MICLKEPGCRITAKTYQNRLVLAFPRRNDTDSQGNLSIKPNSAMMLGCTAATIVWSRANKNTLDNMALTMTCIVRDRIELGVMGPIILSELTSEHPLNAMYIPWGRSR